MGKPITSTLTATSTVADLVATRALDDMNQTEILVFLRLLAAFDVHCKRRMPVLNRELHDDKRTVGRALAGLEARGVVKVRHDASGGRTVELVR